MVRNKQPHIYTEEVGIIPREAFDIGRRCDYEVCNFENIVWSTLCAMAT